MFIYKWPAGKENGTGIVTELSHCHAEGEHLTLSSKPLLQVSNICLSNVSQLMDSVKNSLWPFCNDLVYLNLHIYTATFSFENVVFKLNRSLSTGLFNCVSDLITYQHAWKRISHDHSRTLGMHMSMWKQEDICVPLDTGIVTDCPNSSWSPTNVIMFYHFKMKNLTVQQLLAKTTGSATLGVDYPGCRASSISKTLSLRALKLQSSLEARHIISRVDAFSHKNSVMWMQPKAQIQTYTMCCVVIEQTKLWKRWIIKKIG